MNQNRIFSFDGLSSIVGLQPCVFQDFAFSTPASGWLFLLHFSVCMRADMHEPYQDLPLPKPLFLRQSQRGEPSDMRGRILLFFLNGFFLP